MPRLSSVFPAGAKQGGTVALSIGGGDLQETARLYFSHPAIRAEKIPDEPNKPTRFNVTVPAEVSVGWYDMRCVGKYGISNPRTFVVGDLEEVVEQEPNNERVQATRVPLNSSVNGVIQQSEDVDWFVFSAKKGQRVLVECWAWRIDSRLDGALWLYDAQGKQLAASQDEPIRDEKNDPEIDFDVPADGDYFVKLADFMYSGGGDYVYRLNIGTQPSLDLVAPTGARPGETANLTLFGRNLPGGQLTDQKIQGRPLEKLVLPFHVPADPLAGLGLRGLEVVRPSASRLNFAEVRVKNAAGSSNAKRVVLSQLSEVMEQEPNDQPAQAQRLEVPCAVSGQFSPAKDVDCYVFAAKKGESYSVEVFAQRIGSPADPDLEVLNAKGDVIANAQDDGENIGEVRFASNTRDLRYDLSPPEDGDYTLRLEHLFGQVQGGPQYAYRLELTRRTEDFQLVCQPPHGTRMDSHVVYQGGRQRLDILVWRLHGQNRPITVAARNLPPGVSGEPIVVGPGMKWGTLVLTAAADAPPAEAEIEVVGTAETDGGSKLERQARGGVIVWDTTNTPAISRQTRSIVLAVRDKAPFAITASPAQFTIKQGEPLSIAVKADRRADLPGDIQLTGAGLPLPPGIEIPLTKIAAGQLQAELKLATDKVLPGVYSFIINGEAQVPFEPAPGNKQNLRCLYPTNAITITVGAAK